MYLQAEKALFVHIKQERSGRTFPSPCPSHATKLKLTFFSMQQNTKNFHAQNSTSRRVKVSVADSVVFLIQSESDKIFLVPKNHFMLWLSNKKNYFIRQKMWEIVAFFLLSKVSNRHGRIRIRNSIALKVVFNYLYKSYD